MHHRKNWHLFPHCERNRLVIAGVFFVAWIASTTGLRHDLAQWTGWTTVPGALPSYLAAICSAALIAGTQDTGSAVSAWLGALVAASAELAQLFVAGVSDVWDLTAAALGGLTGYVVLSAAEKIR